MPNTQDRPRVALTLEEDGSISIHSNLETHADVLAFLHTAREAVARDMMKNLNWRERMRILK